MKARISYGPDPDKRKGSPVPGKPRRNPEQTADHTNEHDHPSTDEQDNPSGESRRTVTNKDERITNAGTDSAMEEKEREGV